MASRVQILGSSRLTRVVVPYVTERRGCRVVGIDPRMAAEPHPVDEHEGNPWYAPVRGLARDNGAVIGRVAADLVLDLDPDARPTRGEGPMLRVLAPAGARSPDLNRALLGNAPGGQAGEWAMALVTADGTGMWASRPVVVAGDADALLDEAVTRAVEALDEGWDAMLAGAPATPLPRPLLAGRFRSAETFLVWEQPADRVVARIRACAGPYGGARTHVGEAQVFLLDARLVSAETPAGFDPGVIVRADEGLEIATGRGVVRVERLRPGWRPARAAGVYAQEVGISAGYQLS